MPVHTKKIDGQWRIVEGNGRIAKSKNGKPRDGGGHGNNLKKAEAQARAINESIKD